MAGKHISMLVHFIWSTAGREPWIAPQWQDELNSYIGGILANKNAKLLCAGGMSDHIHVYASLPSTISLADAVNAMKANSSRWIHQTIRGSRSFAWQKGYGAFSVSKSSEKTVINYIQNQAAHHKRHSFKDELLAFLRKHEIEYDERYLWD